MPEDFAQTLYRVLPAYYRERDESGDLRAYLAGCGDLLDAVYATLKQRYADNFPDNPPDGASQSPAQDWLLPYFADLVDATLVSPLPDGRRDELANAIRWRQGKGTLGTIESIVEAIGQTEAVVQEGWQRVAMTPRIDQPLRPAVSFAYAREPAPMSPGNMARHPDLPAATVDMRCPSRAMEPIGDIPGTQRITVDGQPLVWRQGSHHGAPCFAGSYEDVSPRIPDMRSPDWRVGHYHPRRILIHVPPSSGFFPPSPAVNWQNPPGNSYLDRVEIDTSQPGVIVHRNRTLREGPFRPVRIYGAPNLGAMDAPGITIRFEGLSFRNGIAATDAALSFYRCAIETVSTDRLDLLNPGIEMEACLTTAISASNSRARLDGVTVLGGNVAARGVEATDCIFDGLVHAPGDTASAPPDGGCIRFSRIDPTQPEGILAFWQTTTEAPVFFETTYQRRHSGVLSPATHPSILQGAEDEGEMGAFHEARHAAIRHAILTKLADFLPVGQEAVLIPDIRLTTPPWSQA